MNWKGIATGLLVAFVAFCVGLVVLELAVRLLLAQQSANVLCAYQADAVLGWELEPNLEKTAKDTAGVEYSYLVETNSRGERGPETEILGSEFLVVGLGDSFTFGSGVDENKTFLRVLEKSLGEKGKDVKILNLGVGGYSTRQELDLLEIYLEKFGNVELAIIGFFSGNDVFDSLENPLDYNVLDGCLKAGQLRAEEGNSLPAGLRNFFRANFKSYGFFAEKIRAVPLLRDALMGLGLMVQKRPPLYILPLQNPPDEATALGWIETEKQLERAEAIAEKHGIKIILLDIPSNFQVYDSARESALKSYGIDSNGFESGYPEKRIRQFLEGKHGLMFVETLQEFRQSGEKLYYEKDPHWTAEGHALAARILEREIIEKKLV